MKLNYKILILLAIILIAAAFIIGNQRLIIDAQNSIVENQKRLLQLAERNSTNNQVTNDLSHQEDLAGRTPIGFKQSGEDEA